MKRTLLIILTCFSAQFVFSQNSLQSASPKKADFMIYPNPAVDNISISNDDLVNKINIYNLTGKQVKSYSVDGHTVYPIDDLPNGLYLVQLIGKNSKALTTLRLNKRSAE